MKRPNTLTPQSAAAAAALLLLTLTACSARKPAGHDAPASPQLPDATGSCRATGAPSHAARLAAARAHSLMRAAAYAGDQGAGALPLLDQAAACFAQAGDEAAASHWRQQHARWHAKVDRDYTLQRLKLTRALRRGNRRLVGAAARRLTAMVGALDVDYAAYLRSLELAVQR